MARGPALAAKLTPPNVAGACARPRVYELFDRARERPVVWVAAPAGSGKSTSVAAYAAARGLPCSWYSVDTRDRDAASLFLYLAELAQRFGRPSLEPLPRLVMDDPVNAPAFARRFFEALFARFPPEALLVFDDVHVVAAEERWFSLLQEGLHAVPSGACVVLLSRVPPPASFAGMIARSKLAVVGWEELRLTDAEAAELVQRRAASVDRALSHDEAMRLTRLAGGWAAGIVLALECARMGPQPSLSHATTREQIFDYFVSEVIAAESLTTQRFLVTAALLPFITEPLLERLDAAGAARLSKQLRKGAFFVTDYVASSEMWRFHPLFREFLLSRAEQVFTQEELRSVRTRVAKLLWEKEESEAAFELFAQAGEWQAAQELALAESPRLLQEGRARTVAQWMDQLGEAGVEKTPWLLLWEATAELGTAPSASARRLEGTLARFHANGDAFGFWTAWCALAQALQLAVEDVHGLRALVERATGAAATLGFPSTELEAKVTRNVAMALALVAPASPELEHWVERAFSSGGDPDAEELALAVAVFGFPGDVFRLRQAIGRWLAASSVRPRTVIERLLINQAKALCALVTGNFAECHEEVRLGLAAAEEFCVFPVNGSLLHYSAYAHLAVGEIGAAELARDDLGQVTGRLEQTLGMGAYHHMSSRIALAAGDLHLALDHSLEARRLAQKHGWVLPRSVSATAHAEILWRLGEIERAMQVLSAASEARSRAGVAPQQGAELLSAAIAAQRGDDRAADDLLDSGLELGERRGVVPFDAPDRETLRSLCQRALRRGIRSRYVRELVQKFVLDLVVAPTATRRALPDDFRREVRGALRYLHEARRLSASPLLTSRAIERSVGEMANSEARVGALQRALGQIVADLANNARTEAMHRALLFAYVEPAGTQLLAADKACMSFGSFRRHLAAGIEEVAFRLWLAGEA